MIASLPMYAATHTKAAEQRFWARIRDNLRQAGIAAPDGLMQDVSDLLSHWRCPALLLSQTCSLPYRTELLHHVSIVGTPDYGVDGCPSGYYRSVVIMRKDDKRSDIDAFKTSRLAINDPLSQSGWAALALEFPWVMRVSGLFTGSHLASVQAVTDGDADFASIDAVTFRNLTREGATNGVRVIHHTKPSPGLPLITTKSMDAGLVLRCARDALAALNPADRATLGIRSIISLPEDAYDLPIPPAPRANAV